ncbi:MAG: DUF3352 domain-containing protein [Gaiellaceae bacterium]
MSKKARRFLAVGAAFAVLTVVAGCGGSTKSKAGGGIGGSGAELVTSNALAYASIDGDLRSSRWQQLDKLLQEFPIRDQLLTKLKNALAEKDINYERDVKPALGSELDVAAVGGAGGEEPSYIAFTKPDSLSKAKELVNKLAGGSPTATREVDGWLVVADKEAMIDAVLKGSGPSLADDSAFKAGFGSLPDDAIAKAYANGPQLNKLVNSLSVATTAALDTSSQPQLDWLAASLVPEDNGLKLEVDVKSPNGADLAGDPYSSKLISGVPADAIAFLSFHGTGATSQLDSLKQNPMFSMALAEIERELGMSLDSLYALFDHEVAFYVRRGPGLPEFSLVLEEPDTEQALTTLDRLGVRIAKLAHAQPGTEQQGGLEVKTLNFGPVTVRWAGFDGRVLITTSPTGIDDYRSGGDKLADDSTYKDALSTAGAPDQTLGLIYVNVGDAVDLIKSYAGLSGDKLPPDLLENLKPLHSFVAYGDRNGDVTKGTAFLEIK